jgi:hypothetical protein
VGFGLLGRWESGEVHPCPRQGLEERQQIPLLVRSQMEGLEFPGKIGILDPPLVIKLDHLLQGLQTPVVHVRSRPDEISEGRRLEGSFVFIPIGDVIAAQIWIGIVEAGACVVKLLICKVEPRVALRTLSLPFEEFETSLRL